MLIFFNEYKAIITNESRAWLPVKNTPLRIQRRTYGQRF
jgi:hypothetical protein